MKRSSIDPYRILFPIGILYGLMGVSPWILFAFGIGGYPGPLHSHLMVAGFLFSFSSGFLLTAIPRFTGSRQCSSIELLVACALATVPFFTLSALSAFAPLLFLILFFLRRLKGRTFLPPPHFIFLPLGLFLGLTGACILMLVEIGVISAAHATTGRLFLYYATMLAFLLGIGAKLIAALLGWAAPPTHQPLKTIVPPSEAWRRRLAVPAFQAALFLGGFVLEAFSPEQSGVQLGRALRALCATWIAIQNWKVYRKPKSKTKLAFWIWTSAWTLLSGLWLHALVPSLNAHAAHLLFIGGFSLMTLMIASRVTLAHGGHAFEKVERKSRIYAMVSLLILLSAGTRFIAQWTPSYFNHLGYAAAVWILAILVWSSVFLPKMLKRHEVTSERS